MANNNTAQSSIGFAGMLAILFIGLKLTNNISWSWWWVLSPLWINLIVLLLIVIGVFGFFLVVDNWPRGSVRRRNSTLPNRLRDS